MDQTFATNDMTKVTVAKPDKALIAEINMLKFTLENSDAYETDKKKIAYFVSANTSAELKKAVQKIFAEQPDPDNYDEFINSLLQKETIEPLKLIERTLDKTDMYRTSYMELHRNLTRLIGAQHVTSTFLADQIRKRFPKPIETAVQQNLISMAANNVKGLADGALHYADLYRQVYLSGMEAQPTFSQRSEHAKKKQVKAPSNHAPKATTQTAATGQQPNAKSSKLKLRDGFELCYVHFTHGEDAYKCREPNACQWKQLEATNSNKSVNAIRKTDSKRRADSSEAAEASSNSKKTKRS